MYIHIRSQKVMEFALIELVENLQSDRDNDSTTSYVYRVQSQYFNRQHRLTLLVPSDLRVPWFEQQA